MDKSQKVREVTVAERRIADLQKVHDYLKMGSVDPRDPFISIGHCANKLNVQFHEVDDVDAKIFLLLAALK